MACLSCCWTFRWPALACMRLQWCTRGAQLRSWGRRTFGVAGGPAGVVDGAVVVVGRACRGHWGRSPQLAEVVKGDQLNVLALQAPTV